MSGQCTTCGCAVFGLEGGYCQTTECPQKAELSEEGSDAGEPECAEVVVSVG